ncbi:MAG: type IX secretion system outer membrane channel protein PorV [Flavobacterium sp.]|uniref:type IX secretion system outer membrane channel protein PorV n=1 Tax=Flavobacterium sp. TaxID=239 RepID=UPI0022C2535D|nr:type IX secretion system outer membrane channel protein PorV [Flavobacterium sp.]MCZ8197848.1 type IX secretion system outer membrane channel protein PorV [Flavobacterium sp.]
MKKILILFVSSLFTQQIIAQETPTRVITTGVPFLLIAADARSAGLGDQGVATSTDAFSQQYNPAKYAFSLDKQGFSISYTPYLSELVNDISLGQVNYFNRLNEQSAFSASIRYFSLGEIQLTDDIGTALTVVKPGEFAIDGAYALKLSERFSMSVGGRFISSNLRLASAGQSNAAANSFAVDVAGFYQSEEIAYNDFNGRWRAGFNFQNLGPKISYDEEQSDLNANFLPSLLRLGAGFDFILDDYNKVSLNTEVTKLLVPTPQIAQPAFDENGDGDFDDPNDITQSEQNSITRENYNTIGWSSGIFKSFNDAPDGFSEELKEITYSVGTEYLYQDSFAMRLGYFHESPVKGARQFFSLGAGFKYSAIKVDVSYLFSASKVKNPLENTLRFSLSFAFGDKYDEY